MGVFAMANCFLLLACLLFSFACNLVKKLYDGRGYTSTSSMLFNAAISGLCGFIFAMILSELFSNPVAIIGLSGIGGFFGTRAINAIIKTKVDNNLIADEALQDILFGDNSNTFENTGKHEHEHDHADRNKENSVIEEQENINHISQDSHSSLESDSDSFSDDSSNGPSVSHEAVNPNFEGFAECDEDSYEEDEESLNDISNHMGKNSRHTHTGLLHDPYLLHLTSESGLLSFIPNDILEDHEDDIYNIGCDTNDVGDDHAKIHVIRR